MTSDSFIDICEKSLSENKVRLGPMQREIYTEKLRRFSDPQRDKIFDKLLETTKRNFPKIAEIYDAARELGYLQSEHITTTFHHWQPTDCNLCHGEGRIGTIWVCEYKERETGRVEIQRFTRVFPYSQSGGYDVQPGEFRALFRCKCLAGDAKTLPKAWPKWSKDTRLVREVFV